jgi:ABC-type cobalamin/Fe3+-siderophores transport system ATPase subunit
MAENILDVRNLKTYYRTRLKENVCAVDGVSLQLKEGRVLGIAGESGYGKSTLALSLMGFYFPPLHYDSGELVLSGTDIMKIPYETLRKTYLGTEIAYIPQADERLKPDAQDLPLRGGHPDRAQAGAFERANAQYGGREVQVPEPSGARPERLPFGALGRHEAADGHRAFDAS